MRDKALYVVAYDISDDRRRARIHKILSGFGKWTQYSLFECHLSRKQLLQLQARLDRHLKPEEDSVRFYYICDNCVAKADTVGGAPPQEDKLFLV
ncbi:MAG: CRISPR-associated endonuclease Cas2 [Anaerolineae bacterium]